MKNDTLNLIITIVLIVLLIDFLCFIAWIVSGQVPQDGFYAGAITTNVISNLNK